MKNFFPAASAPVSAVLSFLALIQPVSAAAAESFFAVERDDAPGTWFHLIGGNVSKEGITADLEAIAGSGICGIQLFHGRGNVWPRTGEQIQCLSEKWDGTIAHAADECARLGLKYEMQNCPGWSMCGGPWIGHDKAMRRLVCFKPGEKPQFSPDDDFRELFTVEFPAPEGFGEGFHKPLSQTMEKDVISYVFEKPVTVRSIVLPNHNGMGLHSWSYDPSLRFILSAETPGGWKTVMARPMPRGAWQDDQTLTFAIAETTARRWRLKYVHDHPVKIRHARFSPEKRIDNWEARAGWCFRDFRALGTLPVPGAGKTARKAKLVFGHVNMKRRNGPAPKEATGWECDKLDPIGANAMFDAYIGRLASGPLKDGKLKGMLLDSWECGCQNWTWKMEDYFKKLNGYELRPHLPTVFGYPAADKATNEKFLLDWRRTLCRLVEENFYRVMAERAEKAGLDIHFETAFSDVVPGDAFRYWKYADVPMCEFWQPHDNSKAFVGSDDFKPVRSCVSSAHIYGKKRVAAEALTSFTLTWDENFQLFKDVSDRHIFRGVTHLVFHTYTHNPHVGENFMPPGSAFNNIGTPFIRGQTWWKFMPQLNGYFARCCHALERGKAVVDILWLIGDDHPYRPSENVPFPRRYKYDYCNSDALVSRAKAEDGRIVFPDGMSYTALWIPEGTFLLAETAEKIRALEKGGAKIIRGDLKIDWPSQLEKIGMDVDDWYQRRDGAEDIFFVRLKSGETAFISVKDGVKKFYDPVTGLEREKWRDGLGKMKMRKFPLLPAENYPPWVTERIYTGKGTFCAADKRRPCILSLGQVRDWAEVFVNGKKAAVLWCKPYVLDISPFLKEGVNEIKVAVTSTWYNKLVRESQLPEKERTSWAPFGPGKDSEYRPAGLLGPVQISGGQLP